MLITRGQAAEQSWTKRNFRANAAKVFLTERDWDVGDVARHFMGGGLLAALGWHCV